MASTIIEVVGNNHGDLTPPFTIQDFRICWHGPNSIAVESPSENMQDLQVMVHALQPVLLYRLLEPIRLHVPALNANDIVLRDPRVFLGPAALPPASSDIPRIRDVILEHELAASDNSRIAVLRGNAPLLYAIEYLVRGILNPQGPLPELYKAMEVIKKALGG